MEVKKRNFIIVIVFLIILLLIPPVIILQNGFHYKLLANNFEKALSQINADEFENKLIEELKATPFNVNSKSYYTTFSVYNSDVHKEYNGFIVACIKENGFIPKELYIPCFKIERDDNGNIKNFTYLSYGYSDFYECTDDLIGKVLKEQYNVDVNSLDSIIYFRNNYDNFPFGKNTYNNLINKMDVYCTDNDFGATVISEICNKLDYPVSEFEAKNDLQNYRVDLSMYSWKPTTISTSSVQVSDTNNTNNTNNTNEKFSIKKNQRYVCSVTKDGDFDVNIYILFGESDFKMVISYEYMGQSISLNIAGTYTQNGNAITFTAYDDDSNNTYANTLFGEDIFYGTVSEDGKELSIDINNGGDVVSVNFSV